MDKSKTYCMKLLKLFQINWDVSKHTSSGLFYRVNFKLTVTGNSIYPSKSGSMLKFDDDVMEFFHVVFFSPLFWNF